MASRRFAADTGVSAEKTRAEIDALLGRHGATQRATLVDEANARAAVQFRIGGRMVRCEIKLPTAKSIGNKPWRVRRSHAEWARDEMAQQTRSAWRRLLLILKAKLELVAEGGSTFEREFLADVLLPDGRTVHQALTGQLEESYQTGGMPPLLGSGS